MTKPADRTTRGADEDPRKQQARRGVPVEKESQLVRGLRVLEKLTTEAMTASGIARYLGVNRSTSLRLLKELVDAGYVSRDEHTKRFATRPERFYGFIANNPAHSDLTEIITPLLKRLQEESGESVMLGAPANGGIVYVAYRRSSHHVSISERVGTWRPMYCSALGIAYLSALDSRSLDVELGRLVYVGGTAKAAQGPMEFRNRLDEARTRGYAIDHEETFEGGCCVAAPVLFAGALIGAVGIAGPSSRLSGQVIPRLGSLLMTTVDAAGILWRSGRDAPVRP